MSKSRGLPKRVKNREEVPAEVKTLAEQLHQLYQAALRRTLQEQSHGSRGGVTMGYTVNGTVAMDGTSRRLFRKAAIACMQVGADPREYIAAQFKRWVEISRMQNKTLLPMPQHIGSVAAQARYIQYRLQKNERTQRSIIPKKQVTKEFFREERKLKGMKRMLRAPDDTEVLTERPEEFSEAFLKHRGVWSLVEDLWYERVEG